MTDMQHLRGDSGLYFSPQPPEPGLVGERHVDSALFDVKELDAAHQGALEPPRLAAPPTAAVGSGLIDIKTLVATQSQDAGDTPRPLVIPAAQGLVTVPATEPMAPVASNDRVKRGFLIATCVALLAVAIVLAFDVLA